MMNVGHMFAGLMCGALVLAQFTTPPWPAGDYPKHSDIQAQQVYSAMCERAQALWGTGWAGRVTAPRWYKFEHANLATAKSELQNIILQANYVGGMAGWVDPRVTTGGTYNGHLSGSAGSWPVWTDTGLAAAVGAPTNFWDITPWKGSSASSNGWAMLWPMLTNLVCLRGLANDVGDTNQYRWGYWRTHAYNSYGSAAYWSSNGYVRQYGESDTWANAKSSAALDTTLYNPSFSYHAYAWMSAEGVKFLDGTFSAARSSMENTMRQTVWTGFSPRVDLYVYVRAPGFDSLGTNAELDCDGWLETCQTGQMVRVSYTTATGGVALITMGNSNAWLSTWCNEPTGQTRKGWILYDGGSWNPGIAAGEGYLVEWYTNSFKYR